jgi:hypothetical protein
MRIVVFNPNDPTPRVHDLSVSARDVVNGTAKLTLLPDGNVLVSNASSGGEPNRMVDGHVVHGTFFVARLYEGELVGLTLADTAKYMKKSWPLAQGAEAAV